MGTVQYLSASPAQKSGLYISGDFKETGAFTPNVTLSPTPNRIWLKRTTATSPMTPAAKQAATRRIKVKPSSIEFKPFSVMINSLSFIRYGDILQKVDEACHVGKESSCG